MNQSINQLTEEIFRDNCDRSTCLNMYLGAKKLFYATADVKYLDYKAVSHDELYSIWKKMDFWKKELYKHLSRWERFWFVLFELTPKK